MTILFVCPNSCTLICIYIYIRKLVWHTVARVRDDRVKGARPCQASQLDEWNAWWSSSWTGAQRETGVAVDYIQPRTNESRSWLNPCNPDRYVIDIENCTRMIMRGTIESRNERVARGEGGGRFREYHFVSRPKKTLPLRSHFTRSRSRCAALLVAVY